MSTRLINWTETQEDTIDSIKSNAVGMEIGMKLKTKAELTDFFFG